QSPHGESQAHRGYVKAAPRHVQDQHRHGQGDGQLQGARQGRVPRRERAPSPRLHCEIPPVPTGAAGSPARGPTLRAMITDATDAQSRRAVTKRYVARHATSASGSWARNAERTLAISLAVNSRASSSL